MQQPHKYITKSLLLGSPTRLMYTLRKQDGTSHRSWSSIALLKLSGVQCKRSRLDSGTALLYVVNGPKEEEASLHHVKLRAKSRY